MSRDPEHPRGASEGSADCPSCSGPALLSRFDVAVRRPDGGERQFFGLPASLCHSCGRFILDRDAALVYGIDELDVASAIVSDRFLHPADWAGLG